jgi:4-alpha-glucanotransferase
MFFFSFKIAKGNPLKQQLSFLIDTTVHTAHTKSNQNKIQYVHSLLKKNFLHTVQNTNSNWKMKFLKQELLAEENRRPAMPGPLRNWSRGASISLPALRCFAVAGTLGLWKFSMQTAVYRYRNEKIGFF